MSKKFLVGITAVLVTVFTGYGVSKSMNNSNTKLSDLTLTNIEASADGEWAGDYSLIGYKRCVCKRGICSDGAFISFRQICGKGDSDSECVEHQYYGNTGISRCF